MQPEIRENTFDTGIVRINYAEISCSSTPLVLLHGGANRWQSLNKILSDLAATWHVYAPDLRGQLEEDTTGFGSEIMKTNHGTIEIIDWTTKTIICNGLNSTDGESS